MFYDTTYALGGILQAFLREYPDVLNDLRDALDGYKAIDTDISDELVSRFEQWLDEKEIAISDNQRAILLQVAEAFVDLAVDPEETASLTLV